MHSIKRQCPKCERQNAMYVEDDGSTTCHVCGHTLTFFEALTGKDEPR